LVWSQRRASALAWVAVLGLLSFAFGLVASEFEAGGESLYLTVFMGADSGLAVGLVNFCSLLVAVLAALTVAGWVVLRRRDLA
jgi:hypothetical protein